MPKLISIKRPFARKTKDMPENTEYEKNLKNLALKMQEAEDIFTKLAKAFSASKKNLKSPFHQEAKLKNTLKIIDDIINKELNDSTNILKRYLKEALSQHLTTSLKNVIDNKFDDLSNLKNFY